MQSPTDALELFIYAHRALATGLASEVVRQEQLEASGHAFLDDMLNTTPMGLRLTKETLNYSINAPSLEAAMAFEDRHQTLLSLTSDSQEAITAFLQKRPPQYQDT
jgi:enoyl-CoA hydratase/carnithine racemase